MLETVNLSAGYGTLPVVRDVDFTVSAGEIVLVLGPNGAGKSTLMKTLAGFLEPKAGSITLGGESLGGRNPESIARAGLRLVLEGHRVFPELTIEDNLRLGQLALPRSRRLPIGEVFDRSFDVFPILGKKRKDMAQSLSGGQQQMLALVQAWTAQPKILLCDEPSLGLAQSLVPEILSFLRDRADEGMGVVLVEQLIEHPLAVADRVVMLRQGSVLIDGPAADFADRDYVARLMTGEETPGVPSGVSGVL
ncbi:ABC transporter ATP-binding protein [Aeromicrobium chenweiae]|uniref:ABC transporter ATP-binding protein n=1 Tax=Aeromicrobium chenweiae TaxID=2079793 RepID=A0A2S0WPS4_9ACTN|nr:ABC transporter ATP-binding protein [Aeromicrobium chenweiae]AWB93244.1 ABC transporter ATP-binding protein [Aeromicrobium chenweiae]TGN34237.1 ABC transporter ATP-binding protein [Aeromicrobium chenweiae]